MSKNTAMNILSLSGNVSEEIVSKNHRKLIMINHPDKGGSTYLALRINEAKDFLIKDLKNNK